jgi:hypothetical protein
LIGAATPVTLPISTRMRSACWLALSSPSVAAFQTPRRSRSRRARWNERYSATFSATVLSRRFVIAAQAPLEEA